MRHKDVVSLAEQVLPGYEGIFQVLNSLVGSFHDYNAVSTAKNSKSVKPILTTTQFLNHRIALNLLTTVSQIYHNLDTSQKWMEIKSKWPESREGPIVFSGDVSKHQI